MAYKAIDVISIIMRFSVFGWETSFPRKIISHSKTDYEKNKEKKAALFTLPWIYLVAGAGFGPTASRL